MGGGAGPARADNWCGDWEAQAGTARPQGVAGVGDTPPPPVRGWLFEQVEGISNTVNTGALDKTVRAFSSSAGAALALHVQTQGDANAGKQRLRSGAA